MSTKKATKKTTKSREPKAEEPEAAAPKVDLPPMPPSREKRLAGLVETSIPYLEELLNTLSTYGSAHRTKREFLRAMIDEGRAELQKIS